MVSRTLVVGSICRVSILPFQHNGFSIVYDLGDGNAAPARMYGTNTLNLQLTFIYMHFAILFYRRSII